MSGHSQRRATNEMNNRLRGDIFKAYSTASATPARLFQDASFVVAVEFLTDLMEHLAPAGLLSRTGSISKKNGEIMENCALEECSKAFKLQSGAVAFCKTILYFKRSTSCSCASSANLHVNFYRVVNSAVECHLHTVEASGSIPLRPTIPPKKTPRPSGLNVRR